MKIIIFSPYYPPHIGGVEFYAEEMNRYLIKSHNLTIFTPRLPTNSSQEEFLYDNKITITRFPAFEIIPNYPLPKLWTITFWKLFLSLFSQKFDLTISHTRFFNTSLLALLYSKVKKIKWLHIEHGSDFVKSGGNLTTFLAKLYDYTIGVLILRLADKVVAVSKKSASFCNILTKSKSTCTTVIHRGINLEKLDRITPSEKINKKYPEKTVLIFIGRLINGKGLTDLFHALNKIITNDKQAQIVCLIVGNGPQKEELERLSAKLNLTNIVKFLGEQRPAKTISLLKASDIFINPSYTEGLPTTVLEAAACGKAIIATDVGGTNQIITNNKSGYLTEPKNIKQLTSKLIDLITNPDKIKLFGCNARQATKKNFVWEGAMKRYETTLKNITK